MILSVGFVGALLLLGTQTYRAVTAMLDVSVQNSIIGAVSAILVVAIPAYFAYRTGISKKQADDAAAKAVAVVPEVQAAKKTAVDTGTRVEEALVGVELFLTEINRLKTRDADRQVWEAQLMERMAAHERWDKDIHAVVKTVRPDFPSPPPLRPDPLPKNND